MAKTSLKSISKLMADLDFCMFTTVMGRGVTSSCPMSTNSDVEYDGTSYMFALKKSKTVRDIMKNKNVSLSFIGKKMFKSLFISVSGTAVIHQERELMDEHWNKDLEIWFDKGLDTPGLVMIEAKAKHIKYWHGREEGEYTMTK